jgi:hypothetical protein
MHTHVTNQNDSHSTALRQIVAGLEPEATNQFLCALVTAARMGDAADAVQVRACALWHAWHLCGPQFTEAWLQHTARGNSGYKR